MADPKADQQIPSTSTASGSAPKEQPAEERTLTNHADEAVVPVSDQAPKNISAKASGEASKQTTGQTDISQEAGGSSSQDGDSKADAPATDYLRNPQKKESPLVWVPQATSHDFVVPGTPRQNAKLAPNEDSPTHDNDDYEGGEKTPYSDAPTSGQDVDKGEHSTPDKVHVDGTEGATANDTPETLDAKATDPANSHNPVPTEHAQESEDATTAPKSLTPKAALGTTKADEETVSSDDSESDDTDTMNQSTDAGTEDGTDANTDDTDEQATEEISSNHSDDDGNGDDDEEEEEEEEEEDDDDDEDDEEEDDDEEEEEEGPTTLREHLLDLRRRVFFMFVWAIAGFALCFPFATDIFNHLMNPMIEAMDTAMKQVPTAEGSDVIQLFMEPMINALTQAIQSNSAAGIADTYAYLIQPMMDTMMHAVKGFEATHTSATLIYTAPSEAFFTEMKVAFVAGLFVMSPLIFYQVWLFIAPGLYREEKVVLIPLAFSSGFFFVAGGAFCYFVAFPTVFKFFMSYNSASITAMPSLKESLSFALQFMVAFGVVFEMPLFTFFLARLGIVTGKMLRSFWRYSILIILLIAAVLTPPDVISQCLMAGPMLVLYGISILIADIFGKKPALAEGEDDEDEDTDEDNDGSDDEDDNGDNNDKDASEEPSPTESKHKTSETEE